MQNLLGRPREELVIPHNDVDGPKRPLRTDGGTSRSAGILEVVEPRCRVCRDPHVRRLVSDFLDWHGVPLAEGAKLRSVTYKTILDWLKPINDGRSEGSRITYDSLWVHAKRHYSLEGVVTYRSARMNKDLRKALRRKPSSDLGQQQRKQQ